MAGKHSVSNPRFFFTRPVRPKVVAGKRKGLSGVLPLHLFTPKDMGYAGPRRRPFRLRSWFGD